MKKLLTVLATANFIWLVSSGTSAPEGTSFDCWLRCTECKNRGGDKEGCDDQNVQCCEAQDKKGHYKTCGCY